MLARLFSTGLVLAALAAPAAASEPEPRSETQQQRSSQQDPRARRQAPPELICRSVEIAGSRSAMPMVCMSAADWQRAEQ